MVEVMKGHPVLNRLSARQKARLLAAEKTARRRREWGEWEQMPLLPGELGSSGGWTDEIHTAYRNNVFSVLVRTLHLGSKSVLHLGVSSLSQIRPTWPEMQRIKDEIVSPHATAVEVYPPRSEIVDQADMFHIWVLPGPLPFSLFDDRHRALASGEDMDA